LFPDIKRLTVTLRKMELLKRVVFNNSSIGHPHSAFLGSLNRRLGLLRYSTTRLYQLKHSANTRLVSSNNNSKSALATLSDLGILRYRGRRGGRRVNHRIEVIGGRGIALGGRNISTYRDNNNTLCYPHITKPLKALTLHPAPPLTTRTRILQPIPASTNKIINDEANVRANDIPRMYILNAASVVKPHAMEQLFAELTGYSIDVAFISETHLKKHHTAEAYKIKGYSCFRRDRVGRRGGGVAMLVRNGIGITTCRTLPSDKPEYEALWLHLSLGASTFTCGVLYHPPKPIYNTTDFLEHVFSTIDDHLQISPESTLVMAGDFNQLSDSDICMRTGLKSIVNRPTRGPNCLDRVYVSNTNKLSVKVVKSSVKSDHMSVIVQDANRQIVNTRKQKRVVKYRCKAPSQHAAFLAAANSCIQDFNSVLSINETQQCADRFYDVINCIFDKFYPTRTITISDCDPPFITPELKSMLREKNRLMRAGKIDCAGAMAIKIGKAVAKYNSTRLSHIDPRSGTKDLWTEVTRLTKASTSEVSFPPTFNAQVLNDHYAAISTDPCFTSPLLKATAFHPVSPISEQAVFQLLDKLQPTASGLDELPFWFLRVGAPIFCLPLAHLFNTSLTQSIVPTQWKAAVIHPIPKVPAPKVLSDMRPISVLPILSRTLERLVVHNYLNPAFCNLPNSLSIFNQFAYRPTSSTTAALAVMLAHITDLLVDHQHVFVITFDYSKAFDTLRHTSVAAKLSLLDLPYSIYNWILDFLSNRSHCTRFQDNISQPATISASIVQGSVLGPTLFNLNSCDLSPVSPINRYFKYADDAYLVVPGTNATSIQTELDHHSLWASRCNLKLNPTKTSEIVFSRKGSKSVPVNPGITRVESIKILGVTVDNRLTFAEHVETTVTKCNQSLLP
jgi:hypothetical protein